MRSKALINATEQQKVSRHIGRCLTIKRHLENPKLSDEKRKALQEEFDRRRATLDKIKAEIDAV